MGDDGVDVQPHAPWQRSTSTAERDVGGQHRTGVGGKERLEALRLLPDTVMKPQADLSMRRTPKATFRNSKTSNINVKNWEEQGRREGSAGIPGGHRGLVPGHSKVSRRIFGFLVRTKVIFTLTIVG